MLFSLSLRFFLIPEGAPNHAFVALRDIQSSHSIIISIQAMQKLLYFSPGYKHVTVTCFYTSPKELVFLDNKNFVPSHTAKMMQTSNEQISLQELLIYVNFNICGIYLLPALNLSWIPCSQPAFLVSLALHIRHYYFSFFIFYLPLP